MANTLANIMPKILARGLMVLRERCIMPRITNGDYSTEAAEKGDTIDVPVPTSVGVINVTPSNTPPSPTDTATAKVQISLDNWKQNNPIYLTDKEMVEIDRNRHFLPMQLGEAVRALANSVNQSIFAEYKKVYGVTGTPGTTPFASTVVDATNVRKVLNEQLCPKDMRRGVLDFAAEANALALSPFSDAEKIASADVKIEGEIGRKYGIDWFADDHVPTHTAGTINDGGTPNGRTCAVNNGAGYAIGIDTINVDNGAAAQAVGTIVLGDIISFAGHAQTYAVIENTASAQYSAGAYTFATNAIAGLKFYPALVAAVVDNEVITVKASHVVNLAFHRDAFAFATRPLAATTADLELGSRILSMQDPQTGLVLRLEVSRQHKQVAWEFDILWGAKLVRPQLAARIFG